MSTTEAAFAPLLSIVTFPQFWSTSPLPLSLRAAECLHMGYCLWLCHLKNRSLQATNECHPFQNDLLTKEKDSVIESPHLLPPLA